MKDKVTRQYYRAKDELIKLELMMENPFSTDAAPQDEIFHVMDDSIKKLGDLIFGKE